MAGSTLAAVFASGVAALLIAAPAVCDTPDAESYDKLLGPTRTALLAAGDADSLAAAALLTAHDQPDGRLALLTSAAAAAPARRDLAWLELDACVVVAGCDVKGPERRLQALDPGNGVALWGTVARASAGDAAQLKGALRAIAGSTRFDAYWNSTAVHTARALRQTHTVTDDQAATLAIGAWAALPLPPFQPLVNACRNDTPLQGEDLDLCRRLSAVLRHSDTMISEMIGLSMARRAWPAGSAEYAQAADASRVNHYRLDQLGNDRGRRMFEADAGRYLELLATHRTEQEMIVAELAAMGVSADPPAGWIGPTP